MKNVTIYYDAKAINGSVGETCFDITLTDYNADVLLAVDKNRDTAAYNHIENILKSIEILKGRLYMKNSIKCVKEN